MKKITQRFFQKIFGNRITVVEKSQKLSESVIMVTGASRGIGKATAEVLFTQGANLVLISRSFQELEKSFKGYTSEKVLLIAGDITNSQDARRIVQKTLQKFGRVNVLINNAGVFLNKKFEQVSIEEFEHIIDTNLKGMFLMSKNVIPHMKKQKGGFILNIGSKISRNTAVTPHKVFYAATKYAVEGMSFALNRELKPFGIRVSCLMPGTANTFPSRESRNFLSPYEIGKLIAMMIEFKTIDFESITFKSIKQDI